MRATAALPIIVLLASCGGASDSTGGNTAAPSTSRRSVSSELPKGAKPSEELLRMRRIAGVWRSSPGVLAASPKQSVQLEIAFDKSFSMTSWGKDPKGSGEAVFSRQSGKFGDAAGGIAGSTSGAKPSALSSLASWTAKLDDRGGLVLAPVSGKPIALRRVAN